MPLTILIALFGHVFLLMSGALTSPNNVTAALQEQILLSSVTLLLIHPRGRLIFFITASHWLAFFEFVTQYKNQTLFCSSATLPGIGYFALDFILLSSSTLTSTKLQFVDLKSSVSPSKLALHLLQSQQLQLQALFSTLEILLLCKHPKKQNQSWSWALQGWGPSLRKAPEKHVKEK